MIKKAIASLAPLSLECALQAVAVAQDVPSSAGIWRRWAELVNATLEAFPAKKSKTSEEAVGWWKLMLSLPAIVFGPEGSRDGFAAGGKTIKARLADFPAAVIHRLHV